MKKNYARIENGKVVELFSTDGDITTMFHPDLIWVDCTDVTEIGEGWEHSNNMFSPPKPLSSVELQNIANDEALQYLKSTDWYAIRFLETGTPIPADVAKNRADARAAIKTP